MRSVCVDIHPLTNDIASGYNDGVLRFINLNGSILSEHKYSYHRYGRGWRNCVMYIIICHNGQNICLASHPNLLIIIIIIIVRHDSSLLRTVLFTTDGRKCFSADNNGTIGVYDASHNGYPLLTLLSKGRFSFTHSLTLSLSLQIIFSALVD